MEPCQPHRDVALENDAKGEEEREQHPLEGDDNTAIIRNVQEDLRLTVVEGCLVESSEFRSRGRGICDSARQCGLANAAQGGQKW